MLGMLTFRLCLLSKPVSPEFAWKPNAKIIQKFRNRRRCGQISTDGRRNRLLHGPADDRCSCNRGGGRAAPRPKVSVQPADGRRGRGRGFVRPQRRAAGIIGRRSAEQIRADRFVPEPTAGHAGYFPRRKGRRVMAPPRRPVRHSNGPLEAGGGGAGEASPFRRFRCTFGQGEEGGRKTFCGSAPAAENACGIRRNERGEAACGTRPAERERAPGRNRGRAGSGAGNNSAGICAFYRRNFVSLSGS